MQFTNLCSLWIDNFERVKYLGAVEEVLSMNVSTLVKPHLAENPEKTVILFGNRRISYGELDRLINRVASGLLTHLGCGLTGMQPSH